jgi:hypothetical protein
MTICLFSAKESWNCVLKSSSAVSCLCVFVYVWVCVFVGLVCCVRVFEVVMGQPQPTQSTQSTTIPHTRPQPATPLHYSTQHSTTLHGTHLVTTRKQMKGGGS